MTTEMRDVRRLTLPALGLLGAALVLVFAGARGAAPAADSAGYARYRIDAATAKRDRVPVLPGRVRAATFRFAPGTAAADRDAVLAAIARARPEARRLIGLVDGIVDVRVGPTGQPGAIGLMQPGERYAVTVDLGLVARAFGQRGIDRDVLHELGHVIDFALVPDATMTALQAGIPTGYGCDQGHSGACANAHERFAESFAKWATGDIGVDLGEGYKVPPPGPTLDAWGAPLAALGEPR
jgi:hypothetical protein